jgi:hypothetical protein
MHGMIAGVTGLGVAPVNTVAPAVTGTHLLGDTLTSTSGTWTGSPTPTYGYQWQRAGVNIAAATASTYVLVAADIGYSIRCVVTATNAAGTVSANSNAIAFYPTDIATLEQIYDPALGVTVTGQGVSAWVDQATATATNLAQATDAKRMPFTSSSANFNNQPIVSGSGTGTVARAATAADCTYQSNGAGMSIYGVVRVSGATKWLCDTNGGGSITRGLAIFAVASAQLRILIGNGTQQVVDANYAFAVNTSHKFCVTHKHGDTTTDLKFYKNGSALAKVTGVDIDTNAPSASAPAQVFALGNYSDAAPVNAWDDIALWCGFSSLLTTAQRQTMDAYCANRFGIAG